MCKRNRVGDKLVLEKTITVFGELVGDSCIRFMFDFPIELWGGDELRMVTDLSKKQQVIEVWRYHD